MAETNVLDNSDQFMSVFVACLMVAGKWQVSEYMQEIWWSYLKELFELLSKDK